MPEPHGRRRRLAWATAVVLVLGGAAGGTAAAVSQGGPSYRTGTTATATVESLLTLSGTAQPDDRADVDFGASGTVQAVDVALGQAVTAGETLATLVPTSLQRAVTSAQTDLAAAQATLEADEEEESSGTSTDPTTTTTTSPAATPSGGTSALSAAQQAVVTDQQTLDADQQTSKADLAAAQTACGAPTGTGAGTTSPGGGGPTTGGTGTAVGAGTPGGTGTAAPRDAAGGSPSSTSSTSSTSSACNAALRTALSAEDQVADDEKALTKAEGTLAQLLSSDSSSGTTGSSSATRGSSNHTSSGSSGGTSSASQPGSHSGSTSVTPARLASDQETIDDDDATLIEARQSLAAADLVSPIGGTVVSMGIAVGETVTAGSSTDVITVVSTDAFEANATLTASQSAEVKVGDQVTVQVVGVPSALRGSVARVGPVDVDGGNTYPLVVTLPTGVAGLFTGTQAQLSIVLETASHALVVPTPAVHTLAAGRSVVEVDDAGQVRDATVSVGVVGALYTQVLSGIHRGETVVLADMTTPVPTSNETSPFGGVSALSGNSPVIQFHGAGPGGVSFHVTVAPTR